MAEPRTLIGIFLHAVDQHRKSDLFIRHTGAGWEPLASARVLADVESLAHALRALGVTHGDRVAILSENRYEWPVLDLAILSLGATSVPIYPTLTAEQARHILTDSGAKLVAVSTPDQMAKVRTVASRLPDLRGTIHLDPIPDCLPNDSSLRRLLDQGEALRRQAPEAFRGWASQVRPEDVATVIYTSGTTGEPKGAMLTHDNIASNVWSCLQVMAIGPEDRCLSFLPLSHIFERMAGLYSMLAAGASIAYARALDTVSADAIEVRPTLLMGVPRFYEKVFARVMDNARTQPPLRRAIFHWGLARGREAARAHLERRPLAPHQRVLAGVADRLVGAKVRARVGGRLRFCISGGAPLAPKVLEFFFAIGIPVCEGYGLTETSPVICLNRRGREKPGSVGPPIPGVEVRIGEQGEIQTRGPHVMRGYFNNEEATRQAIVDGWFHTGDIGHLDEEGCLHITDRLKDLLVTAGGKKVAPQPIEGRLKTSRWISEAVLIGDGRPYVVCLLVPNVGNLEALAKENGWTYTRVADLLGRDDVRALFRQEIDKVNADLAQFEKIKQFALLDRELSQEGGELTPTLKVRRRVVSEKFAGVIESLFDGAATREGRPPDREEASA